MTKEYWLNEIDKAGTDAVAINGIVLAAGRDDEFHKRGDEGFKDYGEIMAKGAALISALATPEEREQIMRDNELAAKLSLLSLMLQLVGGNLSDIGVEFIDEAEANE